MSTKWTGGYQIIASFEIRGEQIAIRFANGDEEMIAHARLTPSGISNVKWPDAYLSADSSYLLVPADPRELEIAGHVVRTLTDPEFARHMANLAAEQARYIGKRVRELREKRELTQAKLASISGIEQANLSRIENGVFDVSTSTLWKILGAMGFSARDLAS